MTREFIADASVAMGWVHPAQATSDTAAMLVAIEGGAVLEVPALWPLEVANGVVGVFETVRAGVGLPLVRP